MTKTGLLPAVNGEPEICVSAPESGAIRKAETLLDPEFATYTYFPDVSTATEIRLAPVE